MYRLESTGASARVQAHITSVVSAPTNNRMDSPSLSAQDAIDTPTKALPAKRGGELASFTAARL
jgi:hypothetical protein